MRVAGARRARGAAAGGIELDLDDGDDDEGGGAVSAGGTLRAALLLRERDASSANAERASAAAKRGTVPRRPVSSLEAYVSSSADARVVEDALRDADAVDVEKYPSNDDDEVSGEISSKWKRLGTPRRPGGWTRPSGRRDVTTSTTTSRCTPILASGWR